MRPVFPYTYRIIVRIGINNVGVFGIESNGEMINASGRKRRAQKRSKVTNK